jgi:hypothetical protein
MLENLRFFAATNNLQGQHRLDLSARSRQGPDQSSKSTPALYRPSVAVMATAKKESSAPLPIAPLSNYRGCRLIGQAHYQATWAL